MNVSSIAASAANMSAAKLKQDVGIAGILFVVRMKRTSLPSFDFI